MWLKILSFGILAISLIASSTENTKSKKRFTDAPPITAINEIVDINGTTYVFGMTNVNWQEAYVACSVLDMQMLTLDSRAKSDFWSAWLRDNPDYDVWTWTSGFRDYGMTSKWIWNTTELEFDPSETAWAADQPDSSYTNQLCVDFKGSLYGWEDDACDLYALSYICEAPYNIT